MKLWYWKGYEWQAGHPWGIAHPNESVWYSENCINQFNDEITLDIKYEPKEFNGVLRKYSVGVISVNKKFGLGTFIMKCELTPP